jgi:hypothetical protein
MMLPAGIYEVKFGPASWKGIEVRRGESTTIEPGILKVEVTNPSVHINALHRGRWRQDLHPAAGCDHPAWGPEVEEGARITTQDGIEVFRFDAVTSRVALPPGDYFMLWNLERRKDVCARCGNV